MVVVTMLVIGARSVKAFYIKTSQNYVHPSRSSTVTSFEASAVFNSSLKGTTSAVTRKSRKRRSAKKIYPTARFVAISSLANAAASTYPSGSSAGAGAQVNSGSFATRVLEQDAHYKSLDARDRSFARLLVATVERRLGQIDKVLKCCIEKYPPRKGKHAHVIQATLRTGVAQLLFLQTPPFAANKETVQVLRMYPNNPPVPEPMIKFVNGVFRNLSRSSSNGALDETELFGQKLLKEKTSPMDNIAPWLLKRWRKDWGEEKTKLICAEMMPYDESLVTPRIDLSTKYSFAQISGMGEDKDELQSLMSSLGEDSILLPQGSIRAGPSLKGDVKSWPEYDEGSWWVQDASSTLPALVLTRALLDKYPQNELSDTHVVDMCSAPGGKTSQLLCAGFGRVTAIEANPRRSRRLIENLSRLELVEKCQVVVEEGQNWVPSRSEEQHVHGILVDVPCSATGTGARRPDVLRRGSDLEELLTTQEMLAAHCADNILDAGGVMVYATCSLIKAESEDQVTKLIERGNVETLPIQAHEVPGFEDALDDNGWLRVIPGVLEGELRSTDGFFVARLVRK